MRYMILASLIPTSLYCKLARVTHTAVHTADQFRTWLNLDSRMVLCVLPRNHSMLYGCWLPLANQLQGNDKSRATSSITGSKLPHPHGTNGEGPMDPRPIIFALSKGRTDITRGTFVGAPARQAQGARLLRNFYPVRVPFYSARSKRSFLAILLPTR